MLQNRPCRLAAAPQTMKRPLVLSLSKDGRRRSWFDKPVLSEVEGLTMSG